jgi:glutamate formiminotransferase
VVNLSEGRDSEGISALARAAGPALLDLHTDPDHHRSVFTLAGPADDVEGAVRSLATEAVARLDLGDHRGVHPRLGVLDVVPFVALVPGPDGLRDGPLALAAAARDRFSTWAADELELPCFRYGPDGGTEPTLPEVRRRAFADLAPDRGPATPHPTAGACCVGARPLLVAYNLVMEGGSPELARSVAAGLRGPGLRALGLEAGGRRQVSCNLTRPFEVGPAQCHDRAAALLEGTDAHLVGAELVGLVPAAVRHAVPEARREALGLPADRTIEARLAAIAGRGGPGPV